MNGKELLLKALQNQATPRTPWVPFVGVHGGSLIDTKASDYLRSKEKLVAGLLEAKRRYKPDGLPVAFDLQLEAEVLGCSLHWADDTPPSVTSHPLEGGNPIEDLPSFDAGKGRFPIVLDALDELKGLIGDDTALYGLITGPFTLALHLLGNSIFLDMFTDPDRVHRVLALCAEVGQKTALAYLDHGADVIAVVDPMTSQISPEHFEEFVNLPVNLVFDYIRAKNGLSSMFVCGNATRNLESMCKTHCDNVSIDENVPLDLMKKYATEYNRSFGGNIKLTSVLLLGDEDDSKLDAIRCMEVGGTNGFILAPGCDLPYATPPQNLEAVTLMVQDDYQRHIANTTLHAKAGGSYDDIVIPDYANEKQVHVDVITLDSASCAPCQYMTNAAKTAGEAFGDRVIVEEHKITTHEGLGMMSKLGVEDIPTICIDGKPEYKSIIPDLDTLKQSIQQAIDKK